MKRSRRNLRPIRAYTGTNSRTETLPARNISSIENHSSIAHPFSTISNDSRLERMEMFTNENPNRKCVYTYEDKYGFARILTSDSLVFDSHFESGNLHSAFRVFNASGNSIKNQTYDLYIHSDVNTTAHTQWFYFSVANVKQGQEVTFVIRNFSKPESLYNEGMQPLIYSLKSNRGWERCGFNICYFNSLSKPAELSKPPTSNDQFINDSSKKKTFTTSYIMCFTHKFEFSSDVCYFSYCQPYTYTDLQKYLNSLEKTQVTKFLRRSVLCKTLAGNNCDILTVTSPCDSPDELNQRVSVVLTARVHPGESNASWIMQGIIDFLVSDSDEAELLRRAYVFKIIPMVNPDGVINGNYRTSLAGCDLNRQWVNPDPKQHPTIFNIKQMIKKLHKIRPVGAILDIHGHSNKQGVFVYGCIPDKKILKPTTFATVTSEAIEPVAADTLDLTESELVCYEREFPNSSTNSNRDILGWRVRLLPRIFGSSISSFSQEDCNFKMHRSKSATMRMVAFIELGVDCVYTIEVSLAGKAPHHFNVHDLLQIGKNVSLGLLMVYPSMSPNEIATIDDTYPLNVISVNNHCNENSTDVIKLLSIYSSISPSSKNQLLSLLKHSNYLQNFVDEIKSWRRFYQPPVNLGYQMISESGLLELYGDLGCSDENKNSEANENSVNTTPRSTKILYEAVKNIYDINSNEAPKKIVISSSKRFSSSLKNDKEDASTTIYEAERCAISIKPYDPKVINLGECPPSKPSRLSSRTTAKQNIDNGLSISAFGYQETKRCSPRRKSTSETTNTKIQTVTNSNTNKKDLIGAQISDACDDNARSFSVARSLKYVKSKIPASIRLDLACGDIANPIVDVSLPKKKFKAKRTDFSSVTIGTFKLHGSIDEANTPSYNQNKIKESPSKMSSKSQALSQDIKQTPELACNKPIIMQTPVVSNAGSLKKQSSQSSLSTSSSKSPENRQSIIRIPQPVTATYPVKDDLRQIIDTSKASFVKFIFRAVTPPRLEKRSKEKTPPSQTKRMSTKSSKKNNTTEKLVSINGSIVTGIVDGPFNDYQLKNTFSNEYAHRTLHLRPSRNEYFK